MSRHNQSFGQRGEELAAEKLKSEGYELIARNFHTPFGEIDLIFRAPSGEYVFMEVKTRSSGSRGDPEEAITFNKLSRMAQCAEFWTETCGDKSAFSRLDMMAIRYTKDKQTVLDVKWYQDVG